MTRFTGQMTGLSGSMVVVAGTPCRPRDRGSVLVALVVLVVETR
jgi:hypothetical protein